MVKINLLAEGKRPVTARKAKQPIFQLSGANAANILFFAVTVAGLIAAATWYFILQQQIERKDREITVAQKEVDELQQVIKEVQAYETQLKELRRKVEVITNLKDNQRGPVQVMDEISRALPELLWLTAMDVTGNAINFRGTAFNMSAVANFIDNLDAVEAFKEPILQDATRSRARGKAEAYDFRMTVGYTIKKPAKPAEPAPATASRAAPPNPGAIATAREAQAQASGVE
ncbi:MAG TPA: PilN domain-containing protein [Thermoanaerobaculia bacterium]|nr:PilN domain-containing protein [Thermoanaerobaculia bacterium]